MYILDKSNFFFRINVEKVSMSRIFTKKETNIFYLLKNIV